MAQLVAACRAFGQRTSPVSAGSRTMRGPDGRFPGSKEVAASSTTVGQICQSMTVRIESSIYLLVVLVVFTLNPKP